jgi:chromosome segregation ATPase
VATWWQNRATVQGLTKDVTDLSGRLGAVKNDLAVAVGVNKEQDKAISEIKKLRALDSQALTALQGELSKADTRGTNVRQKIAELEKTNEAAKDLLDIDVAPDTSCVLDRTPCPGARGADPNGGRAEPSP